jgi:hypothetical protein
VAPAENQPVAVAMANYVNKEKKPWQPYNTAYSDISEDVREPASVRQAWTAFMQERDGMDYSVAANPVPDPRQRRFVQLVDLQPATIVKNSDQSRPIHLKEKGLVVQNGERQYDLYLQRGDMYVTDLEKRVLAHPYVRQSKESVKYNGNKLLNSSTDCHEAPYNLRLTAVRTVMKQLDASPPSSAIALATEAQHPAVLLLLLLQPSTPCPGCCRVDETCCRRLSHSSHRPAAKRHQPPEHRHPLLQLQKRVLRPC